MVTTSSGAPWRRTASGVLLRVRVTPRSARDEVAGIEATADGPALKVRVRAVPADGAANDAVALAVADWLGVPKRSVALAAGGKSRVKSLAIAGDAAAIEARLGERMARWGQTHGSDPD